MSDDWLTQTCPLCRAASSSWLTVHGLPPAAPPWGPWRGPSPGPGSARRPVTRTWWPAPAVSPGNVSPVSRLICTSLIWVLIMESESHGDTPGTEPCYLNVFIAKEKLWKCWVSIPIVVTWLVSDSLPQEEEDESAPVWPPQSQSEYWSWTRGPSPPATRGHQSQPALERPPTLATPNTKNTKHKADKSHWAASHGGHLELRRGQDFRLPVNFEIIISCYLQVTLQLPSVPVLQVCISASSESPESPESEVPSNRAPASQERPLDSQRTKSHEVSANQRPGNTAAILWEFSPQTTAAMHQTIQFRARARAWAHFTGKLGIISVMKMVTSPL